MSMQLTDQQTQAIDLSRNGFVEAGAGTGKTTVLTARYIQVLIQNPTLKVSNILAITFTEKAAAELKSRIATALVGELSNFPHLTPAVSDLFQTHSVGTIHGFCNAVLRRFAYEANLPPNFELLSDAESHFRQHELISRKLMVCAAQNDARFLRYCQLLSAAQLHQDITALMTHRIKFTPRLLSRPDYPPATKDLISLTVDCWQDLESDMIETGQIDPDFLLRRCHWLLTEKPAIRHYYQHRFHQVMIDEFQDTDPLQWEIIQMLCADSDYLAPKKLFLVGDFKQSIYQFRGATPDLFFKARAEFESNAHSVVIGTTLNFRAHDGLMNPLNHLFNGLFSDLPAPFLPLQTPRPSDTTSVEYAQIEPTQKVSVIAAWIGRHLPAANWSDFAILVRKKRQGEWLKTQLGTLGIPCYLPKSGDLFYQEAIIDLAYLTIAILTPTNELAWRRVLSSPIFDLSFDTQFAMIQALNRTPMVSAILNPDAIMAAIQTFSSDIERSATDLFVTLKTWLRHGDHTDIWLQIDRIIQEKSLWKKYRSTQNVTDLFRHYCQFLRQLCERYRYHHHHVANALLRHLETPSLDTGMGDETAAQNAIPIYTIHSAKGLEFNHVIVPDLADRFNLSKSDRVQIHSELGIGLSVPGEKDAHRDRVLSAIETQIIAEEKRLFYVATTRAKQSLLLLGSPETKTPSYQSLLLAVPDIDDHLHRWKPDEAEISKLIANIPRSTRPDPQIIQPQLPIVSHETFATRPPIPRARSPKPSLSLTQRAVRLLAQTPSLSDAECAAFTLKAARVTSHTFDHHLKRLIPIITLFRQSEILRQFQSASQKFVGTPVIWEDDNGLHTEMTDLLFHDTTQWIAVQIQPPSAGSDATTLPQHLPGIGQIQFVSLNSE